MIYTRSCTEMPIVPISGVSKKKLNYGDEEWDERGPCQMCREPRRREGDLETNFAFGIFRIRQHFEFCDSPDTHQPIRQISPIVIRYSGLFSTLFWQICVTDSKCLAFTQ